MSDNARDFIDLKSKVKNTVASVLDDPQDVELLSNEANLIESGLIDSVHFVRLVNQLESEFGIRFKIDDISTNNFSNINSILKIVNTYKEVK